MGGEECQTYRGVGNEEVAVNGLVVACAQQRLQLLGQHSAHAHRVELYQFGKQLAKLAAEVLTVLLHLCREMLIGQQTVEMGVCCRVYVGGQMLHQVVYTLGHHVLVQLVEDIFYQGRVAFQRVDKGITNCRQLVGLLAFEQ